MKTAFGSLEYEILSSEKIDEIRVSGFAYFKHLFGVNVINKIIIIFCTFNYCFAVSFTFIISIFN